ncbi:YceI family protein [Pontibacter sp. 172403-2]|uniref:YceI family protein n=1 Tax=Pontibacter rufus TaxID=2791028 RepID=UPI0018AF66A3|nr:YceI family protein [Pontibacter sp. 172403-2]MBF9255026.1 YceI family protein [Pontibacter sp. 172403-2]
MKKLLVIVFAFFSLSAFTILNGTWTNDDAHSRLGFTVSHLGIADVTGTFNDFDVKITSAKPDFSDAVVELTAKTASIDTKVEDRDTHLKSADFFHAEKYPTLTYKSTSVKKQGKDNYKITGNLTMNGITKPVTMDMVYRGTVENPMNKKQTAGFQVTGTIKRSDFNLGSGFPAPMISDEVRIKADGEFIQ